MNHKESKEIPHSQGRKTTPATPMLPPHGSQLDSDRAHTSTDTSAYESSEDGAINLVECDQVSVEVKKDKMGIKYIKDGVEGWMSVVKRRKKSCQNISSDSEVAQGIHVMKRELTYQEYMFGTDAPV